MFLYSIQTEKKTEEQKQKLMCASRLRFWLPFLLTAWLIGSFGEEIKKGQQVSKLPGSLAHSDIFLKEKPVLLFHTCLLYTSDAADE